ncbi:hypothetical protein ABKV19_006834 [Rosa sericea]
MVATAISLLATLSSIISVKLDDNNYPTWHFQMYSLLRGHGLLKFVDGSHSCPSQFSISDDGHLTPNPSEDLDEWLEKDCNLISLITATLSPEALSHVVGCNSALEVWTTLKDRYATVSRSNVLQLKSNLQSIEKGSDRIDKYLLRFKNARDQLSAIGVKIADEDIMILILKGLPYEFSTVRMMIKAKHAPISMSELRSLLLAAESELEFESKSLSLTPMSAMVAKPQSLSIDSQDSMGILPTPTNAFTGNGYNGFAAFNGSRNGNNGGYNHNFGANNGGFQHNSYNGGYNGYRPRIICQICEKPGHSAQTCWHLGQVQGNGASPSTLECQLCGLNGHSAADCDQRQSFANLQGQHTAMTASLHQSDATPSHEVWITDSGASSHMTSDILQLNNVTTYSDGDQVKIGNGAGHGGWQGAVPRSQ